MINQPGFVNKPSFQSAWQEASLVLRKFGWETYNLIVHINDPCIFNKTYHEAFSNFCASNSILASKDVAYTIFPHKLYMRKKTAKRLFDSYNRPGGLFDKLRRRPRSGWGTYFRRMTHYEINSTLKNQLDNIIRAINNRKFTYKAAYTLVIQKPGGETVRPLGGPCLNYLAVQMEQTNTVPQLGLLAVYRNHDFLERAYGNYWGLCNLLNFLAKETSSKSGPLTCISSHAYINFKKTSFSKFLDSVK